MPMRLCLLMLVMSLASISLQAQQDPFLGTWKLNLAKSKYDPGPPPQQPTIIKREAAAGGGIKTTTDGVNAQGNPTHTEATGSYDGKDYPVKGSANWDTQAFKRIDARTRLVTNKKAGSVVRLSRQSVSPDGKTYTAASVGINAQGQAYHDIVVYDKQ